VAREELTIAGRRIGQGHRVQLVVAAANRDPERFADPDRLDLGRRENHHLAFGHGTHFCLGAALARLVIQSALRAVLERFPSLWLAGETEWQSGPNRFLRALPVAW
jgi:cytochrome P450